MVKPASLMARKKKSGSASKKTPTRITNGGSCFETPPPLFQPNVARPFFVKVEAKRARARLDGGLRVGEIRDAANFDPRFHLRFTIYDLRWALPDLRLNR